MNKLSALIEKATGKVLKRGPYPREDMALVEGLDPDLEWVVVVTEPIPAYDPIYYRPVKSGALGGPHPEYPHLNTWVWSFTIEKRPVEQIVKQIEDIDRNELARELTPLERDKMLLLGLGVILRNLPAAVTSNFTVKEQTVATKMLNAATKVFQNDDYLRSLITQVEADEEPNVNEGWPNRPVEETP